MSNVEDFIKYSTIPVKSKPGIYVIINITNGKFYIGSAKKLYHRAVCHINDLLNNEHRNPYLQNSFNNGKPDDFKFMVYEYCEDYLEKEQMLLNEFWDNKNYCYNISNIVQGNSISEEGRKKLSEKAKEWWKEHPDHWKKAAETEGWKQRIEEFKEQVKDPEFQKKRIEATIKSKQKYYDIWLINIETKEKKFIGWNFSKFCRELEIEGANLRLVIEKERRIAHGWMLLEVYEEYGGLPPKKEAKQSAETLEKHSKRLKQYHKDHPEVFQKLAEFHGSQEGRELHRQHAKQYRQEHPEHTEKLTNILREKLKKYYDVILINPDGEEILIGWNMSEFCRNHDLSKWCVRNLIAGKAKTHKGWKLKDT